MEKQILWTKRCKNKALVGTVKEAVMQVSNSKKWESCPALDEQGQSLRSPTGKAVLKKSYSIVQDDFFQAIKEAGYTDVERGERGSSEEHLSVTQFKVMKEKERLEAVTAQLEQALLDTKATAEKQEKKLAVLQNETKAAKTIALSVQNIEAMGRPQKLTSNMILTDSECHALK